MTTERRFDPPAARVADVGGEPSLGSGFALALGVLVLLQLAWMALLAPFLLTIVDQGMLSPLGLILAAAGELSLAAGAFRMARRGHQGSRFFLSALVLLLLNLVAWRRGVDVMVIPRVFAMMIATGGALVVWKRRRAMSKLDATGDRA